MRGSQSQGIIFSKFDNDVREYGQLLLFEEEPYRYEKDALPYFENPKTVGERLMNAQHDFLLYGDGKAWQELWMLTMKVAGCMIKAEQLKKKFYLSADDKADRQMAATEYLLRRYRTRRGYYIRTGFIGAIRNSVQHALYYRSESDKLVDFVASEDVELIPDCRD